MTERKRGTKEHIVRWNRWYGKGQRIDRDKSKKREQIVSQGYGGSLMERDASDNGG